MQTYVSSASSSNLKWSLSNAREQAGNEAQYGALVKITDSLSVTEREATESPVIDHGVPEALPEWRFFTIICWLVLLMMMNPSDT